ncbi:MAG: cysteine--tRNA ligase [Candidatus Micrarchaeales archaeon]|nr:cysteine--tRNA ligase [Candidatus Micrarchaeales archaeon]
MLKLYNTLTRKKEVFRPIEDKKVKIYACGLTVYYMPHIGNMRKYVNDDIIRRVLQHDGYSVEHIQNITDVGHLISDADEGDDKLRLAAEKEHKSMQDIAAFYTGLMLKDYKMLNILMPEKMPKASDHVNEMIELIKKLEDKGYLYKTEDGLYFDTSKLKDYGKLTGLTFKQLNEQLKAGARVEMIKGKKHITDFSVWRLASPHMREMVWDSPWGRGFPGWHIECSAMSMKYLGKRYDIHTGGIDHIQVHHTNEIAQSEGATGSKVVNFWVHFNFLLVAEQKMSKSIKNIYTVQEILDKGYSPLALRLLYMSGHYRQQLNFTFEALASAENTLKGIYLFLERLNEVKNAVKNDDSKEFRKNIAAHKKAFFKDLDDDINIPLALSEMHAIISATNVREAAGKLNRPEARSVLKTMLELDSVLGLDFEKHAKAKKEPLAEEIMELIRERENARKARDFQRADEIRKILKTDYKIILEDTPEGVKWHKE